MSKKNNQKTFHISFKTDEDELLEGTFTVKRLSIMDRSKIGAKKSQLSGGLYCVRTDDGSPTGQGLDEETDFTNTAIAHLETALVQKPMWFKLDEINDVDLLRKVYEEVMDFEWSFFRRKRQAASNEESDGSSTDNSVAEDASKQSGDGPTEVVGPEVQAALDA